MRDRSGIAKIVVGVDGSDASLEALKRSQYLAKMLDAHIEAIGCWDYPRMYDGYMISSMDVFKEGAEQELNDAVAKVFGSEAPANLQTILVRGDPRPVLTKASQDADLLIVGRRGHGRLAGLLIGSVSSFCIAHSACPVLVTHAVEDERKN